MSLLFLRRAFRVFGTPIDVRLARHTSSIASVPEAASSGPATSAGSISATATKTGLPYKVERSATNNLPVYSEFRNNRSREMTIIRKIKGNPFALQRDIQKALGVKATVNSGGAIYIKGLVVEPVMQFLKDKGF